MDFPGTLLQGRLLRRYKRFLADIELDDGKRITAHCPNTGTMLSCLGEGWLVLVSESNNLKRKYPFTWEMVHNGHTWILVNTLRANAIVKEALERSLIPELAGRWQIESEIRIGSAHRMDFLLIPLDTDRKPRDLRQSPPKGSIYVEVKSVTLLGANGVARFPDARSRRGLRQLQEAMALLQMGYQVVLLYLVGREDADRFSLAADIDPDYSQAASAALAAGAKMVVYRCHLTPQQVGIDCPLPYESLSCKISSAVIAETP